MIKRGCQYLVGLLLLTMGQRMFVEAGFGAGSYDALCVGLSDRTMLSAGSWVWLVSLVMILISYLLNRKSSDFLALITSFIFGIFFDLWGYIFTFISGFSWDIRACIYIAGLFLAPLGTAIYFKSDFPKSAFDGLVVVIKEKANISVRKAKTVVEISLCTLALLVGGPIGVTTFTTAFLFGLILQKILEKGQTL